MEARVLHAECVDEQLEIDPPCRDALPAGTEGVLPVSFNASERKRNRGTDCVHVLGSNEAVAASPFLPEALHVETGRNGRSSALQHVHSMHSMHSMQSMRIDQTSDKVDAPAAVANKVAMDDEGEHLESLYKSMVKQQEWLGAEILRIKERLRARVHSKSVGDLAAVQGQLEGVYGGAKGAGNDVQDGHHGLKRKKRYKVFRDDTAIAVGCALGGRGMASRMLSEPEAQSVGPLMERSIERERSDKLLRNMRRSTSQTGPKNQVLEDDQLSLCVPGGEPQEPEPISRSREASPPPAQSPASPRIDSPGSPISRPRHEEVNTNDSVDMQRLQSGGKKHTGHGNHSQYNSGKSSYEVLPAGHRPGRSHRDHRGHMEYCRPSASESCPDLLRTQGGSIHSFQHHQSPASDGFPLEYGHNPNRPISPPMSMMMTGHTGSMMGTGMHTMPQMQAIPMHTMAFAPHMPQMQHMQQMHPVPMQAYGPMQPLHPMQMQQMQYAPHQYQRPIFGGVHMQQPMMQIHPMQMQPAANIGNLAPSATNGGSGNTGNAGKVSPISNAGIVATTPAGNAADTLTQPTAAAMLQNVLSEASRIQVIKSAGRKISNSGGKLHTNASYTPHDDNNPIQRDVGDVKLPTKSLAGTPRVGPSLSDISEAPLADIHDLNLTPEEIDTLFEDLELPNLG